MRDELTQLAVMTEAESKHTGRRYFVGMLGDARLLLLPPKSGDEWRLVICHPTPAAAKAPAPTTEPADQSHPEWVRRQAAKVRAR